MRRTPAWVFVAGAAVQLAALGFVVWLMEREIVRRTGRRASLPPPVPPAAPRPDAVPFVPRRIARPDPAPAAAAPALAPEPPVAPVPQPGAARTEIGDLPPTSAARPQFGPPPSAVAGEATPPYVLEGAERSSQLARARTPAGWMHVAFHPDRTIRVVDADGSRWRARVVDAAADLREEGGKRHQRVRLAVAEDGRLQLVYIGGSRDAETIVLDDVVPRSAE